MSTREKAFSIIDQMTEKQLEAFVQMFSDFFDDEVPNEHLLKAMHETEDILSGKVYSKGYNNMEELLKDWEEA